MGPKTWNRVEDLFTAALEQPSAVRREWLRGQCADNGAILKQAEALLDAHDRAGDDFLKAPALDFQGQTFGPYRAVDRIGRGGMSVVYRGERVEGGFAQQAAIKVLLAHPGSGAGFGRGETQILARLEHPNVARLLDAGVTALGFPFLLLEYVEGKPLTAYAAALSERDKLNLFLQVCAGVQYAHQSLVVHRDLKPDNVLVTATGTVKLLDFGIAKMLEPGIDGGEQTTGIKAFTADYASPEQILGKPVTTAADIYSLGVMLCELVGGRRPRKLAGLELGAMIRAVEQEQTLDVPLAGDLGVIARKALSGQPAERYESARAMARDIERYLDRIPIEARPPSLRYRAGRFVARHRFAVAAASAAALALAVATGIAIQQARRAQARFDEVRSLARTVMFDLHDSVAPLPGSLDSRKLIVEKSLRYLDTLARDTSAGEDVRLDVARGYLRLSEIFGKDLGSAGLGQSGEALARALQAVEVARGVVAANPRSGPAVRVSIEALTHALDAELLRGEAAKAVALGEEAVRHARNLAAGDSTAAAAAAADDRERLARALMLLATAKFDVKARDESIQLHKEALAIRQRLFDADPSNPGRQLRLSESNNYLGVAYFERNDLANAQTYLSEALRLDERRYAANPDLARDDVASDAMQLSQVRMRQKEYEAAVKLLERVLAMRTETARTQPQSQAAALRVAAALDRLSWAYTTWGRYQDAIGIGQQALDKVRAVRQADPGNVVARRELIYTLMDLSTAYQEAGQKNRACTLAREALAFRKDKVTGLPSLKRADKVAAQSCAQ